jgi:hypothetical protein
MHAMQPRLQVPELFLLHAFHWFGRGYAGKADLVLRRDFAIRPEVGVSSENLGDNRSRLRDERSYHEKLNGDAGQAFPPVGSFGNPSADPPIILHIVSQLARLRWVLSEGRLGPTQGARQEQGQKRPQAKNHGIPPQPCRSAPTIAGFYPFEKRLL